MITLTAQWFVKAFDKLQVQIPLFVIPRFNFKVHTSLDAASHQADLDSANAKSYRPISNLSVLSKLLEHLVAQQWQPKPFGTAWSVVCIWHIDHEILRRLEVSWGLQGTALSWFTSYLNGPTWFIRCRASRSNPALFGCGVPQGSVLGPILFALYTADLVRLIENFGLHPHL